MAERTGLEPATSAVTGQRSNQLNYRSKVVAPRGVRGRYEPTNERATPFLRKIDDSFFFSRSPRSLPI